MSDVAAGSNAALQLQRNMAAAPDVQQMQTNVMQEQANTLQQQEQNLEKTRLSNIVSSTGIKTDADIRNKMETLVKGDDYTNASPSERVLKMASLVGEAGKPEDMAKLIEVSEKITARDLLNQSKKADIERQSIADASSVLETIPEAQVNERFNSLPEATRNLVINRVGPANWNNFSPKEKKAVVQNLFETANSKLQEQKILAGIQMAQIRATADVEKTRLRLAASERAKTLGDDKLVRIWGTVNTQLEKVQRDSATSKERQRLDEEVDKALTATTKDTTFGFSFLGMGPYKPEGSNTEFYSKDSFNKWQQATIKRDKFIQGQLLEERALVESLPTEAGSIRSNMLKKIDTQLSTLQIEPPKEKPAGTPTPTPTPAKPDVTSNKLPPTFRPLELKSDGSPARTGLGFPNSDVLNKANDAIAKGADLEAVTKRMRDAGYDITTKDLNPEYVEYVKKQKK